MIPSRPYRVCLSGDEGRSRTWKSGRESFQERFDAPLVERLVGAA